MNTNFKLALAAAGVLALSACVVDEAGTTAPSVPDVQQVETAAPMPNWRPVSYQCAGGQQLRAWFSPQGDKAAIEQAGEVIMMNQMVSGSGARYSAANRNYTYQLDTKGNTATLYEAGDKVVLNNCVAR